MCSFMTVQTSIEDQLVWFLLWNGTEPIAHCNITRKVQFQFQSTLTDMNIFVHTSQVLDIWMRMSISALIITLSLPKPDLINRLPTPSLPWPGISKENPRRNMRHFYNLSWLCILNDLLVIGEATTGSSNMWAKCIWMFKNVKMVISPNQ